MALTGTEVVDNDELWEACYHSTLIAPKTPIPDNQSLVQSMSQAEYHIDQSKNRIGNTSGLSLLDRFDSTIARLDKVIEDNAIIKRRLDDYEQRLQIFETHLSPDITAIRSSILDKFAGIYIPESRRLARNTTAHGGNIIADIGLILRMAEDDQQHALNWHWSFEQLYFLPFISSHQHISHGHIRLVKLCNIRANICTTTPWIDDESGKKKEIDQLLQKWMNQGYPTDYWDTESTMTSANNIIFWSEHIA